jgi:DNA-binding transcriptional MerR regulator
MIRIGDFSKLSRVPIKTLRYYDEVGLLKPARVDDWTGYRYYGFEQMACLNRILALKELGFSLEQIGRLLDEDVSVERMRGMLTLRRAEIQARLERESERLTQVEVWLRQMEQENKMSDTNVVIKKIGPLRIVSVRGVIPQPSEQGPMWHDLEGYLALQRVRPDGACFALYHDDEFKERDWDIEVCEPVSVELTESSKVKVRDLPAVEMMACSIYQGPFATIGEAYNSIFEWLSRNGYRINGPCREVYLRPARNGSQNDPQTVTEIQYPVEKAV